MGPATREGVSATAGVTGRAPSVTLPALLAAALLIPYLELLASHWVSNSAHGIASLLAFLAALTVGWLQRPTAPATPQRAAPGLTLLAVCTLAYALSLTVLTRRTLMGISATGIVACLVYLRYGGRGLKSFKYPFVLLLLAVPFPGPLLNTISYHLVDLASSLGAAVLSCLLPGITQEGSVIQIAGHGAVEVISDCNGLAGVLMFLPIAVTVVYFQPQLGNVAKTVILALAVPLALFGNLLRIVATGLLQIHHADLNRSEVFHQFVGVMSLGIALLILILLPRFARTGRTSRTPEKAEAMP